MFLMMMEGFVPKNLIVVSKSLEFMEDCTCALCTQDYICVYLHKNKIVQENVKDKCEFSRGVYIYEWYMYHKNIKSFPSSS